MGAETEDLILDLMSMDSLLSLSASERTNLSTDIPFSNRVTMKRLLNFIRVKPSLRIGSGLGWMMAEGGGERWVHGRLPGVGPGWALWWVGVGDYYSGYFWSYIECKPGGDLGDGGIGWHGRPRSR